MRTVFDVERRVISPEIVGDRPSERKVYVMGSSRVGKRKRTVGGQPPDGLLYSVGCTSTERCDYVSLSLDVGGRSELYLLVDSGADVSLLKSKNLLGTAEFEPKEKIRIKSVDGSVIET
jgi:hypothetical protein